jgi:hypothetical protein
VLRVARDLGADGAAEGGVARQPRVGLPVATRHLAGRAADRDLTGGLTDTAADRHLTGGLTGTAADRDLTGDMAGGLAGAGTGLARTWGKRPLRHLTGWDLARESRVRGASEL